MFFRLISIFLLLSNSLLLNASILPPADSMPTFRFIQSRVKRDLIEKADKDQEGEDIEDEYIFIEPSDAKYIDTGHLDPVKSLKSNHASKPLKIIKTIIQGLEQLRSISHLNVEDEQISLEYANRKGKKFTETLL